MGKLNLTSNFNNGFFEAIFLREMRAEKWKEMKLWKEVKKEVLKNGKEVKKEVLKEVEKEEDHLLS
jgi:hypothetical protein